MGRIPIDVLQRELTAPATESLRLERDRLAARTLLLQELLGRVAAHAAALGIPIVALKGIALLEVGHVECGSRRLLDLDLLTSANRATELGRTLEADGYQPSGAGEGHHLAPLVRTGLGAVELHLRIPGVSLDGRREATAEDLFKSGRTRPSARLEFVSIPSDDVLVAHAVTHALDQHGLSPAAYPVTRVVADLVDLAGEPQGPFVADRAQACIAASVSKREIEALESLCRALAAGDGQALTGDAQALLDHTCIALSSPGYRRRLRRRAALRAFRRGHWSKFRTALAPSAADTNN